MPTVLFEKRPDGVALITLNKPETLNAMGPDIHGPIAEYLEECDNNQSVRCVALTGTGRGFCSGADIKSLNRRQQGESPDAPVDGSRSALERVDQRARMLRHHQDTLGLKLHTMDKPTVALVNGYAIGAGFSLALACDMRVMGSAARLSAGFAKLAVSGDGGGTYFLAKLVGSGIARELCFTAEMIDAERSLALGLVNHVYPQEDLLDEGLAFCAKIAAGPTGAFAKMKRNLNFAWYSAPKDGLDYEAQNMVQCTALSADHREAVRAFIEKRDPQYIGA